jgi:acyl-coenzyme A synthetase/AMP-(fatty) acid ligase/aryl carrier-like protein
VIYTSGSTGRPKGVMVPHAGVYNLLCWGQAAFPLGGADRVLQKTPFSFDVSVLDLFWPLAAGSALVVARPEGHLEGAYLVDVIRREAITVLHYVPSLLRVFLQEPGLEDCFSVRVVFCCGEAVTPDLVGLFRRRWPHVELVNLYGPTEASVLVTTWTCPPYATARVVPIGRPVWNTKVHVLDAALEPVPAGVAGELWIGGAQLAQGYLGRPELTAERFIPDPYSAASGGRLYRTGDRVRRLADGQVEYLGRLDFQVKVRGFRVELGEVEAALGEHPRVREAVVAARSEPSGSSRLVAWVVSRSEPAPTVQELRDHLRLTLPEPMIPSAFALVAAFPRTASGKLDRRALLDPEAGRSQAHEHVPPSNPVEETLAGIWSAVLSVKRVGAGDNFFHLGGDSIQAMQVVLGARKAGLRVSPQEVFQLPTLADLAVAAVPEEAPTPAAPVEPSAPVFVDPSLNEDELGKIFAQLGENSF